MSNYSKAHIHYDDLYHGSRMFQCVADTVNLPIDQVNFLITQVFALLLAHVFRVLLHPSNVSSTTRHWTAFSAGICMSYFCFGKQVLLPILFVIMCYSFLLFLPSTIFHHVTLIAAIAFLSIVHLQRLLDGAVISIDISAPLMIMVQKATSLAYSLSDGEVRDQSELTALQRKFSLRYKPSLLQYLSYLLCFQSILAGPFFMFTEYQDFVEGKQYLRYEATRKKKTLSRSVTGHMRSSSNDFTENNNERNCIYSSVDNGDATSHSMYPDQSKIQSKIASMLNSTDFTSNSSPNSLREEPNPSRFALKKMFYSLLSALVVIYILPCFPIRHLKEPSFLASSFLYKTTYILLATTVARYLYYTAWFLADAVCSMSGLGFNGFDENGHSKWNLVSNVEYLGVEFGASLKSTLDAWNIGTMKWLRLLVYDRVRSKRTFLTFLLSSVWHGFYPGYYITFMSGLIFTIAARKVRKCVRPWVLNVGPQCKYYYDIVTFIFTRICLSYLTFPFLLLHFWNSVWVYDSLKYYFHSLSFLAIVLIPIMFPAPAKIWRENENNLAANEHTLK